MVKKSGILREYDSKQNAYSNWQTADGLYSGWFIYSPQELKERYRDSGQNEYLSKALEREMQMLIAERIGSGEIIALGVQISPELKSEAERIPKVLFQSTEAKIDWDRGQISGLGREFHDVRICLALDMTETSGEPNSRTDQTKRGRKSHSPIFEEAFAQLELEHKNFTDWSLEKQTNEIREKAAALHPGLFRGTRKPGRSTVYRFLQVRRTRRSVP
jgi:hypothetical protein